MVGRTIVDYIVCFYALENVLPPSGVPYDCDSIMHFGTETFSLGKPTMASRRESCNLRSANFYGDIMFGKEFLGFTIFGNF